MGNGGEVGFAHGTVTRITGLETALIGKANARSWRVLENRMIKVQITLYRTRHPRIEAGLFFIGANAEFDQFAISPTISVSIPSFAGQRSRLAHGGFARPRLEFPVG